MEPTRNAEDVAGLHFDCVRCEEPIDRPGALLFGPPDQEGMTLKSHFCADCYYVIAPHIFRKLPPRLDSRPS